MGTEDARGWRESRARVLGSMPVTVCARDAYKSHNDAWVIGGPNAMPL